MMRGEMVKTMLMAVAGSVVLCAQVFAASVSVDTANATWGDGTVTVPVAYVASGDSVSSMNFSLTFDDSRYDVSTCTIGAAGTAASKQVDFNKTDATTVKVIVYGLNNSVLADGVVMNATFSVVEGASDGEATFAIADQVAASNTATAVAMTATSGTLTLDQTAPTVTISEPADGATFGREEITVAGTVDDLAITTVSINGTDVDVTDGAFSTTMTLAEGDTTITITAVDGLSNEGSAAVTVTYTVGDVDEDGVVDATDITSAKNQLLGTVAYSITADMNNDGAITVIDLQTIINKTL